MLKIMYFTSVPNIYWGRLLYNTTEGSRW